MKFNTPKPTHFTKKRMGQHFLKSQEVIRHIVFSANIKPTNTVIEIGPGQGALTEHIVKSAGKVHAVELDRDLIPYLQETYGALPHFQLHHCDALKLNYQQTFYVGAPLKIIGNLPYNISTPLLFHLMQFNHCVEDYTFMLQKEVVDRIVASPGGKDYGRLSIMLQIHCKAISLFDVEPQHFLPPPKVYSSIVQLTPRTEYIHRINELTLFSTIVLKAFNQRRKTIKNSLKIYLDALQSQQSIDLLSLRPEEISIDQYINLCNEISKHGLQSRASQHQSHSKERIPPQRE